jgi:hypothetical protein
MYQPIVMWMLDQAPAVDLGSCQRGAVGIMAVGHVFNLGFEGKT